MPQIGKPAHLLETRLLLFAVAIAAIGTGSGAHAAFSTGYTDGASWNTIYAQGFSPAVGSAAVTGVTDATPVELLSFSFFKSGASDSASDIRLAILDGLFADVSSLTVGASPVLGVSTNAIASTASLALGDPIAFDFAALTLDYGGDYGAVLVTEGSGGELTPVLVSALTTNYVDDGSGTFRPETNYGTEDDFQYAVSNFIDANTFGQFFNVFSFAGDANFQAEFTVIPEPAAGLLAALAFGASANRRRRDEA